MYLEVMMSSQTGRGSSLGCGNLISQLDSRRSTGLVLSKLARRRELLYLVCVTSNHSKMEEYTVFLHHSYVDSLILRHKIHWHW